MFLLTAGNSGQSAVTHFGSFPNRLHFLFEYRMIFCVGFRNKAVMKVSKDIQFDLAFLWKTIEVVKDFDDISVVTLYEKFSDSLKRYPRLSLSIYWDVKYKSAVSTNLVGVTSSIENQKKMFSIFNISTLKYLKDTDKLNLKHDPLDLVHKLYIAASESINNTGFTDKERTVLLSACLLLSVKSGRVSLLLQSIGLILNNLDNTADIDGSIIKDIYQFLCSKRQTFIHAGTMQVKRCFLDFFNNPVALLDSSSNKNIRNDPNSNKGPVNGGMLLSFGKADHGEPSPHVSLAFFLFSNRR
jgi:hypothetical protein